MIKKLMVVIIVVSMVVGVTLVASVKSQKADGNGKSVNYVKQEYMVIPWGNGEGEIPLYQREGLSRIGGKCVMRIGPRRLLVDGKGNVYVVYVDVEAKEAGIKVFGEDGSLVRRTRKGIAQPDNIRIIEDEIVATNNYRNAIFVYDYDLNVKKMIKLPKDEFKVRGAHITAGALVGRAFQKRKKDVHIFDKNKHNTGANEVLASKITVSVKAEYEASNFKRTRIEIDVSATSSGKGIVAFNIDTEVITTKIISVNKSKKRIYVYFAEKVADDQCRKVQKGKLVVLDFKGNMVTTIRMMRDDYIESYVGERMPVAIDNAGRVYQLQADSQGLHVYRWYLN